ncbi:MAG: hypothetical protein P1V20_27415 [Verrucomicrobiales bacterium]|nr:hypothetical protein [Verrucomicrobiales bacterium]
MSWLLKRIRSRRELRHHRKVKKLQKKQRKRIHEIVDKYKDLNFFGAPDAGDLERETGMIADAREKYALYLLQRVGIYFIPDDALLLARKYGPAYAAERVCLWLGLDYHKIAAVAPRVASETARATRYFKEMQLTCDATGISADALLPHIHFGSHDTRDVLFESFRISARIIELFDKLDDSVKDHIEWDQKRPLFINGWQDIDTDCLLQFYNQGILLSEYRKTLDINSSLLNECSQSDPGLIEKWLSDEAAPTWQKNFPEFKTIVVQVHLANRVREVNYRCSREWNRILKTLVETEFNFQILTADQTE